MYWHFFSIHCATRNKQQPNPLPLFVISLRQILNSCVKSQFHSNMQENESLPMFSLFQTVKLCIFLGDADIMIKPSYASSRPRPRKPSRTPSMPAIPLKRLEPMVDEVRAENKGYGSASLNSSVTSSRLLAPHRRIHHRTRDCEPKEEEQQNASTVWSPETPEQGTGEARNPLLRRPQWKPQDQQGQQK